MTDWTAFGAVTGLVLLVVLALARSTAASVDTDTDVDSESAAAATTQRDQTSDSLAQTESVGEDPLDSDRQLSVEPRTVESQATGAGQPPEDGLSLSTVPTPLLFANVVGSHGVLAAVLLGAAVVTAVPWATLGVTAAPWSTGLPAVGGGLALGVGLSVANEALTTQLDTVGIEYSETLQQELTPETTGQWLLLLGVVLPVVAGFEELLFRAALIGAIPAGIPVSPAVMVVASTVFFALGHGLQGLGGILVTGLLGSVLGVAFLLSESLLCVVVAHYVVNALEFLLNR